MLLCLVGCGTLFLPWAEFGVMYVDPSSQADGAHKLKHMAGESLFGYQLWHGTVSAFGFLILLLLLLVTEPLRPVPWWRSAALLAGALAILGVVLAGMNYRYPAMESDLGAGRVVLGRTGIVNYLALGLGAGLGLIAALELRARVAAGQAGLAASSQPARNEEQCQDKS